MGVGTIVLITDEYRSSSVRGTSELHGLIGQSKYFTHPVQFPAMGKITLTWWLYTCKMLKKKKCFASGTYSIDVSYYLYIVAKKVKILTVN